MRAAAGIDAVPRGIEMETSHNAALGREMPRAVDEAKLRPHCGGASSDGSKAAQCAEASFVWTAWRPMPEKVPPD